MEHKLVTKEQKSILAKLLASENLIVEHGNYNTASFDVKNRVLRLPVWKEMSGSLYDLLVLHEVGHALFTPEEGYHDAEGYGKGFKSFLNVVEDARIERKIKAKFPGGRRSFVDGYKNLMDRDFFGLSKNDISKYGLIDKINLHYKVGDYVDLTFDNEEQSFLDRIDKADTWKTVVEICKDLYKYAKENESETDMSDHDFGEMMMGDDDDDEINFDDEDYDPSDSVEIESSENSCKSGGAGDENGEEDDVNEENDFRDDSKEKRGEGNSEEEDSKDSNNESGLDCENSSDSGAGSGEEGGTDGNFDDYEPESKTDDNFRNNEIELVSDDAKPYKYVNIPHDIPLENVIVDFTSLYKEYEFHYANDADRYGSSGETQIAAATEKFNDFRSKNKKVVEYLAKEFEMKKAAKDHARAATANSGILDSERLHTYKYNEHLFKKLTVIPDGKNHGLLMFVDWSGSMSRNMKGTIEQMMVLVMFCKRVNIPFDVYAFSDSYGNYVDGGRKGVDEDGILEGKNGTVYGNMIVRQFNLLNLFSSKMRAKQLRDAYIYMTATAEHFTSNYSYGFRRDEVITIPSRMTLGGTPLDSSLIMGFSVMRDFMKRNPVDVINSIYLTDGDSHSCNEMWTTPYECKYRDGRMSSRGNFDVRGENVVLRDPISKKQHLCTRDSNRYSRGVLTENLVKFQREVFDINIVNFFLVQKMKKWDIIDMVDQLKAAGDTTYTSNEDYEKFARKFRKDKYMISPEGRGFNELYTILGGKHLEVSEEKLEVAEDASVAQMARAFKKFSSGKLEKRKLLSRFIDMVAA